MESSNSVVPFVKFFVFFVVELNRSGQHGVRLPTFNSLVALQERFYDLVSGRTTGIAATLCRGGLRLLEVPYGSATSVRNFFYDHHWLPVHHISMPIISVGNLTLGGTGKSPMVAWLCRRFLKQNLHPGLISRGYG